MTVDATSVWTRVVLSAFLGLITGLITTTGVGVYQHQGEISELKARVRNLEVSVFERVKSDEAGK